MRQSKQAPAQRRWRSKTLTPVIQQSHMPAFVSIRIQSWLFLLGMVICSTGCGGPPKVRTTFLNSVDLLDMTDRMAASFANDAVIGERSPDDKPWVISINRVANHTNQIIPEREKWLYIGRLRAVLAQSPIARDRSIIWVIPPERWPIIAHEIGAPEEPYGLRMAPTHLLTAAFHSLTLTHAQGRSDTYVCDFQLLDLATSRIVWEDRWEVKRAIEGLTFD